MDWIRRNWPDLLIGFALLAVISGIVATLLTGGSFLPGQGSQPTPPPQPQPTQVQQQPQQPAVSDPGPLPQLPLMDPEAGDSGLPASLADGPVDPFATPAPAINPPAATEDPQELPTVVAIRPGTDPETVTATAPQAQPDAPAAPAAPTQPAAGTSSGQMPSAQVPYTVGVGAFQNADNAQRQADVFRQAGYPVVVASQDAFTVVLLGPYANRSEADRVSDTVATGGFNVSPIVYTYQGEDAGGQQTSAVSSEPPAAPAAQPAAPAEPAQTATAAGRYLQVGAYSSDVNAGAQASLLEGLGFSVVQQQDGNLIRVLVGPYQESQLDSARNSLAAQGIDSVPR